MLTVITCIYLGYDGARRKSCMITHEQNLDSWKGKRDELISIEYVTRDE